jgi:arsenite-transporting ATPase
MPLAVRDPVLCRRQADERRYISEVLTQYAKRTALVPWQIERPVGYSGLKALTDETDLTGLKCPTGLCGTLD